ncbi:MAG: hypothetical protein IPL12_08345 [Bacteroidetes bacterium]|nr:hypothetical protein [Bacteroidota bacterium]
MAERRNKYAPVEPEDKKRITKESLKVAVKILRFLKPYKTPFIIGSAFLLLSSLTTMTFPYFMGKLIDSAKNANNLSWMNNTNTMALILIGILLLQSVMSFFRVYLFATASERAMADVDVVFR